MKPEIAVALAGRPSTGAAGARLGELFAEHGKMVYGLCRLLLRDPVEAEDAAQQSFLSAYTSMLSGTTPRKPGPWLAAIARNECRGRIRERMREPLPLEDETRSTAESPAAVLARKEEMEALRAGLEELPEKQRQAVVLRDVYGLRYGEVCTALGLSLPAVESLLMRGRRRLQGRLTPLRVASALTVPLSLHDSLALAAPGFAGGSAASAGGVGVGAGAAMLGKLSLVPAAAKVAAATLVVTAVGAVSAGQAKESEARPKRGLAAVRAPDDGPRRPGVLSPASTRASKTAVRRASPEERRVQDDVDDKPAGEVEEEDRGVPSTERVETVDPEDLGPPPPSAAPAPPPRPDDGEEEAEEETEEEEDGHAGEPEDAPEPLHDPAPEPETDRAEDSDH